MLNFVSCNFNKYYKSYKDLKDFQFKLGSLIKTRNVFFKNLKKLFHSG
jgi:hypothetical protein